MDCTDPLAKLPMSVALASKLLHCLQPRLTARREELRALLQAAAGAVPGDAIGEVLDFKDVAAQDTSVRIDEAALGQAAQELAQVDAALRRVRGGSYGECADCGDPIEERRLLALPATAFCTACQAIHERPSPLFAISRR
jgi:DnaK suppressor protein